MGKWRTKLYKTDRARDFDHERDRQVRARQVYETIDRQPFQWMVVVVAGIGFFLDGYTLFATNIALPMIAYVYWNTEVSHSRITAINTATLAGTIFGQIVFGLFADSKGRKRMYGVELVILIISTFGVVMSSVGQHNSMSIFGWLITWRLIAGIGVGADYPLSAIITSEFAPTAQRARMMASVFFMQPLGQIASNIVALIVIVMTRRILGEEDLVRSVDIMWRWIIGTGVVPAVLAIILRLTIPETPRFTLEIEDDPVKAEFDATNLFGEMGDDEDLIFPASKELEQGTWILDASAANELHRPAPSISSIPSTSHTLYNDDSYDNNNDNHPRSSSALSNADWTQTTQALPTLNSKWSLTRADLFQYFIRERNVLTLIGTSFAWLLLDFCFYGIGLSSPHFLAKTWGTLNIHGRRPPWQISDDPTVSVYTQFLDTTVHSIVILNLGSVVGALLLVLTINRLNRVTLQRYSFLFLAAIFIAMGVTFLTSDYQSGPIAIVLYVIAQTAFNFGPNATTYILPSELFPTRYRATCHGISAALGKLGSILMQIVDKTVAHNMIEKLHKQYGTGHIDPQLFRDMRASRYAHTLLGYSAAMILGFLFSLLIPHVQSRIEQNKEGGNIFVRTGRWVRNLGRRRWKSKTLEELSLGRAGEKTASVARARRTMW